MDKFLSNKENTHDSSIMNFIGIIIESISRYNIINENIWPRILRVLKDAKKARVVINTINKIRETNDHAINSIIMFAANNSEDLFEEMIKELYVLSTTDIAAEHNARCSIGYINNIASYIPVYFPNLFENNVALIPMIVEEIDGIIDLAVDTNMSAEEFKERMSYYIKTFRFSQYITNKCISLINFYTNEHD